MLASPESQSRSFVFEPTPAVAASRARSTYINCAACQSATSDYLFHRTGVRFVRCRNCGLVYVSPVGDARVNYFDIERTGQYADMPDDRAFAIAEFEEFLLTLEDRYKAAVGRSPKRIALLGRFLNEFADSPTAKRLNLEIVRADDAAFDQLVLNSNVAWAEKALAKKPDLVVLHELLEATSDPSAVMTKLKALVPASSWFAVTYSNAQSMPAMMMRRYWSRFYDFKRNFFNASNLNALMARSDFLMVGQFAYPTKRSVGYALARIAPQSRIAKAASATKLGALAANVRTGHQVAIYRGQTEAQPKGEKLSIVFPVFNEVRYVAQVIEAIMAKPLTIDRELIIVESNSTDGTRDIIKTFEGREGIRILYEDKPQGKGHAVRTGLHAVTGTIVLIQDADFEYDVEDYDALLEPILQHRATFVLGSRSLGIGDWKVRKFAKGHTKAFLLNFAQLVFAETFNILYQQDVTDVNTMYKVFRADALHGMTLRRDGFEFDIELACKLVRTGNAPIEVPVNYVARGFEEGKKIRFMHDSWVSYFAFFQHRFD